MEYDVPRSLDVPDRLGIPLFTTMQFAILIVGLLLMAGLWKLLDPFGVPVSIRAWLLYLPVAAAILPRSVSQNGWTVYRVLVARGGRYCRPRRAIWRPT
jgi:hypothetical protein